MAVTAAGTGTQTATISTEHTLLDTSAAATYQLVVDTVNMASGDVLELRCYSNVLTGGTRRGCYLGRFSDAQPADDTLKVSVPISTDLADSGAMRFTLKQVSGTGRSFDWKVLKFA